MKTKARTLPEDIAVTTLAKWREGEEFRFKLEVTNIANGQSMKSPYSGGCLAFNTDKTPSSVKRIATAPVRTLHDEQQKKQAIDTLFQSARVDPIGVIHSLLSDSRAGGNTFKDFCTEYGYDEDSRKAFSVWEACVEIRGDFLRVFRGRIAELEALTEDY